MKNILVLALACSVLSGCGVAPDLFGPLTPLSALNSTPPAEPRPPRLGAYRTKVYWSKDIQELARDLRRHPRQDVVIYGVSANGYRVMQNNWSELAQYIEGQKHIIAYYRNQGNE